MIPAAFDAGADAYDAQFTRTLIGGMMRQAVWARCTARFEPGSNILEMNCGTGEDALWLARSGMHVLATDAAPGMLRVARRKFESAGSSAKAGSVRFALQSWEQLHTLQEGPFDGALSNFGGLNCVADLRAAAVALADKLAPGKFAILCVMGPRVPWEWLWYLMQGRPERAFRRLARHGATWSGMRIRYPTIGQTSAAFAPHFRLARSSALGALLPPPYTGTVFARARRLLELLNAVERLAEAVWPLPALADHYLLELERR